MTIRARFKGATTEINGTKEPLEFLEGIPARNLDADEYTQLSTEDKQRVRTAKRAGGQPLYELVPESPSGGKDGDK